ncbi:hypothetical protein F4859DRAFT_250502 [Xylaria cf. heliscus]|nr:hypothetical protein F4859DRAFT_250502 [Xylaria cf. heliscus]
MFGLLASFGWMEILGGPVIPGEEEHEQTESETHTNDNHILPPSLARPSGYAPVPSDPALSLPPPARVEPARGGVSRFDTVFRYTTSRLFHHGHIQDPMDDFWEESYEHGPNQRPEPRTRATVPQPRLPSRRSRTDEGTWPRRRRIPGDNWPRARDARPSPPPPPLPSTDWPVDDHPVPGIQRPAQHPYTRPHTNPPARSPEVRNPTIVRRHSEASAHTLVPGDEVPENEIPENETAGYNTPDPPDCDTPEYDPSEAECPPRQPGAPGQPRHPTHGLAMGRAAAAGRAGVTRLFRAPLPPRGPARSDWRDARANMFFTVSPWREWYPVPPGYGYGVGEGGGAIGGRRAWREDQRQTRLYSLPEVHYNEGDTMWFYHDIRKERYEWLADATFTTGNSGLEWGPVMASVGTPEEFPTHRWVPFSGGFNGR